jgi:hypothetical protein
VIQFDFLTRRIWPSDTEGRNVTRRGFPQSSWAQGLLVMTDDSYNARATGGRATAGFVAAFAALAIGAAPAPAEAGKLSSVVDAPAPGWVLAIKPGTWAAVSRNTLADVDPAEDPKVNPNYPSSPPWNGSTGQKSVLNAWNGGAFANNVGPLGSLIAFGGGHANYFGNEIYAFDLATQLWSRVTDPFPGSRDVLTAYYAHGEFPDGSPLPPHTYDYVDYHPASRSLVLLRGVQQLYVPSGGVSAGPPHLFDFTARKWRRGPAPAGPYNSSGWSAYDSSRDVFWVNPPNGEAGFRSFDPNARGADGTVGAWSEAYGAKKKGHGDGVAAYDPVNDIVVYTDFASDPTAVYAVDLGDPAAPSVALREGGTPPELAKGHGWEWSDLRGSLVYWPRSAGAGVHELRFRGSDWRSGTWTWSPLTDAGNQVVPDPMTVDNGVYSRFRLVRFRDAEIALVVNRVDGPVYAFRMPEAGPSRPSAPKVRVDK